MPMRVAFLLIFLGCLAATDALARSPLVIFNTYTPPLPTIAIVSIYPGDHAQMNKSPESVKVSFSAAISEDGSDLEVYDPYNNLIAKRGTMTKDTAMEAKLPPELLSGTYRIEWKAMCLACSGGSVINGTSYFTIF